MVLGRFKAVLSYLRSLICVLWLIIYDDNDYAAVVVDQVSIVMPLLHLAGYRTIFYCHYPDKLLSGSRGLLKRFYRFLLDLLEEVSLLFAHKIYVNSEYTRTVFRNSFPLLRRCQVQV